MVVVELDDRVERTPLRPRCCADRFAVEEQLDHGFPRACARDERPSAERGVVRVELGEHVAQRVLAHRLQCQLVAEALELAVVVDRQAQHGAGLVQLAGRVADVTHAVDRTGALEREAHGVVAHRAHRGGHGADGAGARVPRREHDVGADLVAAHRDVVGQLGRDEDLPPAPQGARRLEDDSRAQQVGQEGEAVAVLHDDVVVGDDAEDLVGVLADRGVDAVDRAAVRAVQGLLGHRPGQAAGRQRLVERARCVVEHDAEAVPAGCRTTMSESRAVMP